MTTKPLLDVLGGNVPETPPVWLMRQAGRYLPEYRAVREKAGDFLSLCFSPDFATEVTLQPIRRYGFDAAILFSDILVIPHGLGQKVAFRQGEGPVLEALGGAPDLDRLNVTGVSERLAPVYEAVGRIRRALPAGVALIGFAGAPWTVASYMVEGGTSRNFTRVRDWSIRAPDSFGKLFGIISEATLEHLSAQIEAGAEVIQIFDSWSGILDDEGFGRWVSGATRDLVAALRRRQGTGERLRPRGGGRQRLAVRRGGAFRAVREASRLRGFRFRGGHARLRVRDPPRRRETRPRHERGAERAARSVSRAARRQRLGEPLRARRRFPGAERATE